MENGKRGAMFAVSALRAMSILCLVFFSPGLPSSASAQSPQEVQKISEQAIRRLDLQTKLPTGPEPQRMTLKLPPEALWVVIVIALGVLIYAFRDMLPFWRTGLRGGWGADETAPGDAAGRAPEVVLGAADELARDGRYVEAMHVLLLQALADMRRRLGEQFADSFTSREILRHTKLSAAGQGALRDIVERVEWTYFGQRPAAEADYQACRASFGALAQALRADERAESRAA
jgi:hypothetical protein